MGNGDTNHPIKIFIPCAFNCDGDSYIGGKEKYTSVEVEGNF